jgi:hypothetical protein
MYLNLKSTYHPINLKLTSIYHPINQVFSTMESTMEALFNWMAIGDPGDTPEVFNLAAGAYTCPLSGST